MVDSEGDPLICLGCGEISWPDPLPVTRRCNPCKQKFTQIRMKQVFAVKRSNGWVPKRYKESGKKAYITRMARMSVLDPVTYQERMEKEAIKDPERASKILRKSKSVMRDRLGYHDPDLGKVIF